MTINEYFGDWSNIIDLNEADRILRLLASSKVMVCPSLNAVFRAFRLCPLHKVRVVLIGQDPYSDAWNSKPRATGIAFGNDSSVPEESISPSLKVLRESVIDYTKPHGITTFDQSLEKWEEQGVLLLNVALSCEAHKPGSHILLWKPFIKSLLTSLSENSPGTVYVLMGSVAQSLECCINTKSNYVIRTRHPSYYVRTHQRMPSDTWRDINKILIAQSGYGIEWFNED